MSRSTTPWQKQARQRRPLTKEVQRVVRPDGAIVHLPSLHDEDQAWHDDALCAETGPELFFPEEGESYEDAKTICRRCPVQDECLDYALRHSIEFGVWGGTTPYERRQLRRNDSSEEAA